MECTVSWTGASGSRSAMGFVAETGSGHVVAMDGAPDPAKPDQSGQNLAARPMELMLAGAGGCTAYDVVLILKRGRHAIQGCTVKLTSERAEVGEEREALLAVTIPEERGSFKRFCALLGDLPSFGGGKSPRSITEFNYRISDAAKAHVFVGLTTGSIGESTKIAAHLSRHGFESLDLTHDDLAKEHIRHMVGGRSALALEERLLRFVFPERPGALMKFLSAMRPGWNISLFHYRNQGADYGRILVGLQVPAKDQASFEKFLDGLGYPYVDESANPVYKLFLQQ